MKKRIIEKISIIFAGMAGVFSALETLFTNGNILKSVDRITYVFFGLVSAALILYYIISGKKKKKADTWIVFLFFLYVFITTWAFYGFSKSLFAIRFYYVWLTLFFGYFAVRQVERPYDLIRAFSFTNVSVICVYGVSIAAHATMTLKDAVPEADRLLGCFREGRLCGMTNANTMAFHCMTAMMFSIFGIIKGSRIEKIFYGVAGVVLWFLLGLNNSRTANYALALTVAAFAFAALRKYFVKKGSKKLAGFIKSAAAGVAAALCVVLLLMVPTPLYRAGVTAAAKITGDQQTLDNVALVYEREITDVDTLNDRQLIWKRSVELIFKNPRRMLFGISMRSSERLYGAYEGRHDIVMPFAHTMLLEVFRRFGLIGLIAWIVMLCIWGGRAVRKFFDTSQDIGVLYLMSTAAGVLLTSITEMGPFAFTTAMAAPYIFFLSCGMAMRNDENEKDLA